MAEPANNGRRLLVKSLGSAPQDIDNSSVGAQAAHDTAAQPSQNPTNAGGPELRWWDRNPIIRAVAAEGAREAATSLGETRGAWHMAEGLLGTAAFIHRLGDPLDAILSPPGEAASDQVVDTAKGVVDYFKTSTPRKVAGDIGNQFQRFNASIDPTATPQAPTLAGEIGRNFQIGMNQGELAFDIGSTLYGGEAIEGLAGLGGLSKAATPAKYLARGYSPGLAEYFATPYPSKGMGHHFLPRAVVKNTPVPLKPIVRAISDSRFSVLKPTGISRGDMYELHYGVDPDYYGGKMGRQFGGGRWSGKDLDWQKYGLLGRIVHGSPAPLKAAIISPSVITAGAIVDKSPSTGTTQ